MHKGRGNLGSRKHGRSGTAPKSPRLKHAMQREAQKQSPRAKRTSCRHESVEDLLRNRR